MRNKSVRGRRRGEWESGDCVILFWVLFALIGIANQLLNLNNNMEIQNKHLQTLAEQSVLLNKNLEKE